MQGGSSQCIMWVCTEDSPQCIRGNTSDANILQSGSGALDRVVGIIISCRKSQEEAR